MQVVFSFHSTSVMDTRNCFGVSRLHFLVEKPGILTESPK
ncbi:hypothetical protein X975_03769, partial [Stegodyphus mimosarum]